LQSKDSSQRSENAYRLLCNDAISLGLRHHLLRLWLLGNFLSWSHFYTIRDVKLDKQVQFYLGVLVSWILLKEDLELVGVQDLGIYIQG
jgi:hypothetical protein